MQSLNLRPFPAVEKPCPINKYMAVVLNRLAAAINLNFIDSLVFSPDCADHSRVKLDIWVKFVLVRKVLEILLYFRGIGVKCAPIWVRLERICILVQSVYLHDESSLLVSLESEKDVRHVLGHHKLRRGTDFHTKFLQHWGSSHSRPIRSS
jgi:hypothetical protein